MKIKYIPTKSRENYKLRVGFNWSVDCTSPNHCNILKSFLDSSGIDYTYIRRNDADHSFFMTNKNAEYFKIVAELDPIVTWSIGSYININDDVLRVILVEIV